MSQSIFELRPDFDRDSRSLPGKAESHHRFSSVCCTCMPMQCSVDTLRARLKEAGVVYRHHLPADQLLSEIHPAVHLHQGGRAYGYRPVQAALADRRGVRATNSDILDALRQHGPAAVAGRQERIIHRRITDGMVLWPMDSEHLDTPSKSSNIAQSFPRQQQ